MGMPNVLKHFATFIDGTSYVGEVQEITPPKLTRKMEEFRAGGMRLPVDIDSPASNGGRGLKQRHKQRVVVLWVDSPASNGGRGLKRPSAA